MEGVKGVKGVKGGLTTTYVSVLQRDQVIGVIRVPKRGRDVHGGGHGSVGADVVVGVDGARREGELLLRVRPRRAAAEVPGVGHCCFLGVFETLFELVGTFGVKILGWDDEELVCLILFSGFEFDHEVETKMYE